MTTSTLPVFRRSAIEAASQCLFRYKKLWIDGVEDQSDYALRGIVFHLAANRYIHRLVAKQIPSDQEEANAAFQEGVALSGAPGRLIDEVRDLFDRWASHFDLDLERFVAAEEREETSDQAFTPDLVYAHPDELEIRDFKTYFVALTETQGRSDWQARWYVRNAMKKWPGFPRYRFTFDFVRYGTTLSLTFSAEELAILERDTQAVLAMIVHAQETGKWPATPGPACGYCELECPIVEQPGIYPKRLTDETASAAAGWVLAAEQQLKAIKKALKIYCAANGAVAVQGVEFANRPVVSRSYPIEPVVEFLKQAQAGGSLQASPGLTVSQSALKGAFKAIPALEADLKPYVQEKTTYRFGPKKPGHGEMSDTSDEE
jgi:hypothetical protein